MNKIIDTITTEVIEVTPAIAQKWLKKNHDKQRRISWARVESFIQDMKSGAWKLTHQGICFGADGSLIDGQHRLQAIAKSGVTCRMLVMTNQEGEFEAPIDRGRVRALADICGMTSKRLAAYNVLKNMENGFDSGIPFTLHDAEVFKSHHGQALGELDNIKNFSRLPAGAVAAMAWAYPINPSRVTDFVTQVVTGEMLSKGQPALTFRRWNEKVTGGAIRRIVPWDMAMATCNCLRYVISGGDYEKMYTGPSGYRAITTQRRKMRIPYTPSADLVEGIAMESADMRISERE